MDPAFLQLEAPVVLLLAGLVQVKLAYRYPIRYPHLVLSQLVFVRLQLRGCLLHHGLLP
jgi:hypothetical protein